MQRQLPSLSPCLELRQITVQSLTLMSSHMPTVALNTGGRMPILVLGAFAGGEAEASVVQRYLRCAWSHCSVRVVLVASALLAPLLSQRRLLRARVCLGCSNPVGRGGATQLLDPSPQWEQDAEAAVRAAIDLGYRAIDTAEIYGTEQAVGAPHSHLLPCHSVSHTNLKSPCVEQAVRSQRRSQKAW